MSTHLVDERLRPSWVASPLVSTDGYRDIAGFLCAYLGGNGGMVARFDPLCRRNMNVLALVVNMARRCASRKRPTPVVLAFTYAEAVGYLGARQLVKEGNGSGPVNPATPLVALRVCRRCDAHATPTQRPWSQRFLVQRHDR